jgi:hypothetical protein
MEWEKESTAKSISGKIYDDEIMLHLYHKHQLVNAVCNCIHSSKYVWNLRFFMLKQEVKIVTTALQMVKNTNYITM